MAPDRGPRTRVRVQRLPTRTHMSELVRVYEFSSFCTSSAHFVRVQLILYEFSSLCASSAQPVQVQLTFVQILPVYKVLPQRFSKVPAAGIALASTFSSNAPRKKMLPLGRMVLCGGRVAWEWPPGAFGLQVEVFCSATTAQQSLQLLEKFQYTSSFPVNNCIVP